MVAPNGLFLHLQLCLVMENACRVQARLRYGTWLLFSGDFVE